ncbi:flagellin domain protein [Pseudarthrobacter chlorophenolicus A6]|uniref:Flagellin n=1 Tax=Pseudarthrobacter chlorophenolicus (strain ATCC 700700 / DSM 12829 / CIP 107037 / JCM 12360 / KCTC 9906 / NCIMB 13794 / A6) TaxID=452863 RepID=B8HEL4_PSECP|nr:flagellin [Pseudarthrobacter chlorophenolicus]ACL40959.1 flagellin domain protein [Pseudarthrobacter chlorophenolicus A6]SDQ72213.1 flagellin [Pseudarthrobacter chlorophenolicus]
MGMQINTNLAANNAYRSLSNTQNDLSKSLEKLSSGLRINRAGDDAAGLAISESLKSQIGGLNVASRNAQDGIGLVQTAEGGLSQAHSILQRLRDLGVQAANDTNNTDSRAAIKTEATSLVEELGRIAGSTDFNGTKLLNGDNASLKIQVGANGDAASQIGVDLSGANVKAIANTLNLGALASGGSKFDIADATALAGAATFSSTKDGVVTTVTTADLGAAGSFTSVEGYADALRKDADFSSKFTVSVEKDANGAGTGIVVQAKDGGDLLDADNATAGTGLAAGAATASVATGLDFSNASKAQASITLIDTQIKNVSTARADLGATQNRLESAVQTINVAKENLTASNSRIRDTDMAEEMVKFTRNNILSQAGTAMLAQANQSSQGVLQLLR